MAKTVACIMVKSEKVFSWLGHMPIMLWSVSQLTEVRGIDRIVCVASPTLSARAKKLLAREEIEVVTLPKDLLEAKDGVTDKWLTAADGPAFDADTIVVMHPTSPFLPAAKIEACVRAVNAGKCSTCYPARPTNIVVDSRRKAAKETVDSVRAFRVNVPAEHVAVHTVPVSMIESLNVNEPDEYVLVDALVASDKI